MGNDNSMGCAEGLGLSAGSLRVSLRNQAPLYLGVGLDRVQAREALRLPRFFAAAQKDYGRGLLTSSELASGVALETRCVHLRDAADHPGRAARGQQPAALTLIDLGVGIPVLPREPERASIWLRRD